MGNYIKNLLKTKGFKEIEQMFQDSINECKNPSDISDSLDDKTYAREVRARVLAGKHIEDLLKRIKLSAGKDIVEKISYK